MPPKPTSDAKSPTRATKARPRPAPTPEVAPAAEVEPAAAVLPAPAPKATPRPKASRAVEQRAKTARRASVMLKFVSDPTRLRVVLLLAEDEHHVGALCEQLGQSQPAVSHHLALLRHGGVISPRRVGKNNFYSLSPTGAELAKMVKLLLDAS